jgi:uncharacterized damage-inducible protein DinB
MNKMQVDAQWDFARMVLRNVRRQVERIPSDKLDFRPTPDVRTISELVVHLHQYLTDAPETVLAGKHVEGKEPHIIDKAQLIEHCDAQVARGYDLLGKISEEQVSGVIEAWGQKFPGWQLLGIVPTEIVHHRGQLMTYLRLLGVEPVFAYDFEEQ